MKLFSNGKLLHGYCKFTFSLSVSSALVASSSSKKLGSLINALAMAIRCFWPPDRLLPFSPTSVSYPSNMKCYKTFENNVHDVLRHQYLWKRFDEVSSIRLSTRSANILYADTLHSKWYILNNRPCDSKISNPIRRIVFNSVLPLNRTGSCPTSPILYLKWARLIFSILESSIFWNLITTCYGYRFMLKPHEYNVCTFWLKRMLKV